jgi:ABC-type phosphate/phosphonate transport system ATPase subunit
VENNCIQRSPYPGLRPFTEAESDLFFGREKHTAQLRSKLERNRFVAVVGSSGSGKSSLVRAGLIAQLKGLGDPDDAQTPTQD